MIIAVCGKGGVGKTTVSALLLDELAACGYPGPVLAVDGDPASTLTLALGLPEPKSTVADIRDNLTLDARTVRSLPVGMTPARYVFQQVQEHGVLVSYQLRQMPLDLMVMGQGEGPGCYCSINNALALVLKKMIDRYSLILIDNEAGLEHISRYRLERADLFLVVTTPGCAAQSVAQRIIDTAVGVKVKIGETWKIFNQTPASFQPSHNGPTIMIPPAPSIASLESEGRPVIEVAVDDPVRRALQPLLERIRACV
ncbi:MAG: ATP-binding protein [Chloroflexota bacterium]|nr:MAG: ATP-binding protein [Chloroflexota bacterium]